MSQAAAPGPLASATVVLARERAGGLEVLMLRRPLALRFMGGMWVFPGGRLDPADRGQAADPHFAGRVAPAALGRLRDSQGRVLAPVEALAQYAGACRETREETGVELDPGALVYFAHWVTPAGGARRFDTHFFLATPDAGAVLRIDPQEASEHEWIEPAAAIALHEAGTRVLAPPTVITLADLAATHARLGDLAALGAELASRDEVLPLMPRLVASDEECLLALMPWDAEYGAPAASSLPAYLRRLPSRVLLRTAEAGRNPLR